MTLKETIETLQKMIEDGISPDTPVVVGEYRVDMSYEIYEIRYETDLDPEYHSGTEEVVIDYFD